MSGKQLSVEPSRLAPSGCMKSRGTSGANEPLGPVSSSTFSLCLVQRGKLSRTKVLPRRTVSTQKLTHSYVVSCLITSEQTSELEKV